MSSNLIIPIIIIIIIFTNLLIISSIVRHKKTHVVSLKYKRKEVGHPENLPLSQVTEKRGRIDTGVNYEDIKVNIGGKSSRGLANMESRKKGLQALASVSKKLKGGEDDK